MAQEEVFEKDVEAQVDKPLDGPNSSYYNYNTLSIGMVLPIEEPDTLMTAPGFVFNSTSHYKWKMTNWYSLGLDIRYRYMTMPLASDSIANPFYPVGGFKKQTLKTHRIDLGGFMRFNFDKRGNYLGKFLDLGAWGGFNFSQRIKTQIELDSKLSGGVEEFKTVAKKLSFTEKLAYGLEARIGFNKIELGATYRLSDFFRPQDGRFQINDGDDPNIPDMPRLVVSIGVALPN